MSSRLDTVPRHALSDLNKVVLFVLLHPRHVAWVVVCQTCAVNVKSPSHVTLLLRLSSCVVKQLSRLLGIHVWGLDYTMLVYASGGNVGGRGK